MSLSVHEYLQCDATALADLVRRGELLDLADGQLHGSIRCSMSSRRKRRDRLMAGRGSFEGERGDARRQRFLRQAPKTVGGVDIAHRRLDVFPADIAHQ